MCPALVYLFTISLYHLLEVLLLSLYSNNELSLTVNDGLCALTKQFSSQ